MRNAPPTPPEAAEPIRPMSLLDWQRTNDGYAGGDYRIRLVRPNCWEVRHRGEPVATLGSLKQAMTETEFHFRERLRKRDLVTWGIWSLIWAAGLIVLVANWVNRIGSVLLFAALTYALLSAATRFIGATGWVPHDPYRRRLPWERRDWYRRS